MCWSLGETLVLFRVFFGVVDCLVTLLVTICMSVTRITLTFPVDLTPPDLFLTEGFLASLERGIFLSLFTGKPCTGFADSTFNPNSLNCSLKFLLR